MFYEAIITTLLRGIPEAFLYIFCLYLFSDRKIDKRRYIVSIILLSVGMILVRALPISYGIHTIIIMMAIIAIAVLVNHFDIIYSIKIVILNLIIQFIAEGINIILIEKVFMKDVQEAMATTTSKMIYGIPSLIIAFCMLILVCKIWKRQMRKSV